MRYAHILFFSILLAKPTVIKMILIERLRHIAPNYCFREEKRFDHIEINGKTCWSVRVSERPGIRCKTVYEKRKSE